MRTALTLLVASALLAGCDPEKDNNKPSSDTKTASVVAVGVESGFAGACPGSKLDATRMRDLLKPYAAKMTCLTESQATKQAVAQAMADAVKADLMVFYFSGHGTHTKATTDKTEVDGEDEYICCYDTVLSDNEIWSMISKSKGRVVLIFDCCHSGTMWRTANVTFAAQQKIMRASTSVDGPISMICWSGCPDSTYSYGSDTGGFLTNTLRKHFSKSLTYDQLWKKIESDSSLKKYEIVQQTKMGKDFGDKKVFQ